MLFHFPGQRSSPACLEQAGAGAGKESQFTVSTKSAGGEQVQAVFYTSRQLPVVSPQKRTYRNLNTGCSKCQGILKELTGYFLSTFLKCAADVCLKKIRESLTLKVCIVSCEIPKYFLWFTLMYVLVTLWGKALQKERILEPPRLDLESCRSQVDICVHKTRDNFQRLPCLLCVIQPRQRIV